MRLFLGAIFWVVLFLSHPLSAANWQEYQGHTGSFKILFPATPNHLHNQIQMKDVDSPLNYDIYVAPELDTLYLMLVADLPRELTESQEILSLEGFMKGILKDKEENSLLFVDSLQVQGHSAMDFVMKSKKDHFFKGRVVATGKKLYLLTVEYTLENFNDHDFKTFVDSFVLLP